MRKALIAIAVIAAIGITAFLILRPSLPIAPPSVAMSVQPADPATKRTLVQGALIGFADANNTYAWLGIPYAQPPVGELRWRAPRPAQPWQGTLQALQFGAVCPQIASFGNGAPREQHGQVLGAEDCLTLNVWAPRFGADAIPQGDKRLPVLVWIHGGGNVNGASSMYPFVRNLVDPYRLVVVSINYRLGLAGWFRHPVLFDDSLSAEDRSGNYGTLDAIQALRWVQDNIHAFGGDPARVTIAGESAGGANVYALLLSPLAKGLFQGAIMQSGAPDTTTLAVAENYSDDAEPGHERSAREVVNQLLIRDGMAFNREQAKSVQNTMSAADLRAYLYKKTPADLLAAITEDTVKTIMPPNRYRDGAVLPAEPPVMVLADPARYNAVPVIAGTNKDEMKLFNTLNPEFVDTLFGVLPRIKDKEAFERVSRYGSDNWKFAGVDEPLSLMRAGQGASTYGYRFDWDDLPTLPVDMAFMFGAPHAAEINFVFNAMHGPAMPVMPYSAKTLDDRIKLARIMSSYWAEFVHTGKPGRGRGGDLPQWSAWDNAGAKFMVFDSEQDGGVRMSADAVTKDELTQRLLQDRARGLIVSQEQLCRRYAELFVVSLVNTGSVDMGEYETFGDGGCKQYPAERFRSFRAL